MNFLSRRGWWLAGAVGLFSSGAIGVACSNGNPTVDGGGTDSGGSDTTTDGPGQTDGPTKEGGPKEAGPCSTTAVKGTCDIVVQDCPSGQECAPYQQDAGGWATHCVPNTTGAKTEGYACTPASTNPCTTGLECINNRCSRHCCLNDDSVCGTSYPEGFQGRCDLNITLDGVTSAYAVCTYAAQCEPFNIAPCSSGSECIVKDVNGTASCTSINGAGLAEKAQCKFANDCQAGLGCYGSVDGGSSSCQWNCYVPPGPFDAGIKNLPQGQGGCNTPEKCMPINWGGKLPTWLGICQ